MKLTAADFVGPKTACKILDLTDHSIRRLGRTGELTVMRDDMNRRKYSLAELKKLARKRARR